VSECPALRIKDACALRRLGPPQNISIKAGLQTVIESRLEGGVNRVKLKFTKLITTTSRVSVRNIIEFEREGAKQIASE
jgi:hypothetical protein